MDSMNLTIKQCHDDVALIRQTYTLLLLVVYHPLALFVFKGFYLALRTRVLEFVFVCSEIVQRILYA
jgi:hypothetical protein